MKHLATISLLCMLSCLEMQAQRGFELGGMLGLSNYFGDINPTYSVNRVGPAGAIVGRYNFNSRLSTKLALAYGHVKAYDSDSDNAFQRARNLHFRSGILDASLQIEFNFFQYIHGSPGDYYTPYIFLGAGVYRANPKAELDGEWIPLQPLGTEGQPIGGEYSLTHPALAYGIGFKADFNYQWSFNVELSARSLFDDHLDDVSTTYPNLLQLGNLRGERAVRLSDRSGEVLPEPIGETGRQRGNSRNNDSYAFLTVGVMYYFGNVQCPGISRPQAKTTPKKKRKNYR